MSISNISFNEPISPVDNSHDQTSQILNQTGKNDSKEYIKKDLPAKEGAPALKRRGTVIGSKKPPKAGGKPDISQVFQDATGGSCDLSSKGKLFSHRRPL